MVSIEIRAAASTRQAQAQFAALTAQVEAMNRAMAQSAIAPTGNVKNFNAISRGAAAATRAYNSALASSGQFRVEQLRINDAVTKHTDLLQRQKLGFNQVFGKKSRSMMQAVYREQLAMQSALARTQTGLVGDGRQRFSLAVPTNVHQSWDTLNNRVGFFRERLASASSELINWGKNTQWAGRQLMAGISMPVAAFGAAAGVMAFKTEQAFAKIAKVYDLSAEAQNNMAVRDKEIGELRVKLMENAEQAARRYGSSLMDTMDIQQQLAATGLTGSKLTSTTGEISRISALGDIEADTTTAMVISLQTAFRDTIQDAGDLTRTLNFMNAASNASSLSLQDIAEATPRAASSMAQLGATAEEMTILLASMRESGVDAAQGANALKSATTRIINPVAKAVAYYSQFGISLERIRDISGGNLFEYLRLLGEEQQKIVGQSDKQTNLMRAQGIATLFGTYQNNRLTASLVNLTDAYGGVQNQTAKVIELQKMSSGELEAMAKNSEDLMINNPAGRFKQAFETLKIQLAEVGGPFLEVASAVVKVTSKLFDLFNSMPDWAKKGAIFALILGALVGPVVMLIGLFANFAGNMGKFVAWSLKAVSSFEMMSKTQFAAKVSAELAERAFLKEATAAEILAAQMRAVATASQQAAAAMAAASGVRFIPNTQVPTTGTLGMHGPAAPTNQQWTQMYMAEQRDASGRYRSTGIDGSRPDSFVSGPSPGRTTMSTAEMQAQTRLAEEQMRLSGLVARNSSATADAENRARQEAMRRERATRAISQNLSGGAIAMGAMGTAAAVMMLNINDTTNSIAKWVIIGSLVVPAVKMLATGMVAANAAASGFLTRTIASGAAMYRNVGAAAAMTATIRGSMIALNTAMGPVGWITLALTAGAAVGFKLWQNAKKAREEHEKMLKQQADLVSQTDRWVAAQGEAVYKWKQVQSIRMSEAQRTEFDKTVEFYRSEEERAVTDQFNNLDEQTQANRLIQKYIELIQEAGLTAAEARSHLEAFLNATGMGLAEARPLVNDLTESLGDLANVDWLEIWKTGIEDARNSLDNPEEAKRVGEEAGKAFREGLQSQVTGEDRANYIAEAQAASTGEWADALEIVKEQVGELGGYFRNIDWEGDWLESPEALQEAYWKADEQGRKMMDTLVGDAATFEATVVQGIATAYGISEEIRTWGELLNSDNFFGLQFSFEDAKIVSEQIAQQRKDLRASAVEDAQSFGPFNVGNFLDEGQMDNLVGGMKEAADESAKMRQNSINTSFGLKEGDTYAESLSIWLEHIASNAEETADAMERAFKNNNIQINLSGEDVMNITKAGMEGVQTGISDSILDDFDDQMDARSESLDNYWDKRLDALDNRQEQQLKRFENRWERRREAVESAYDARIDKINDEIEAEQKAEEIRKRIFEAEQTRISRLAEAANRTIDFNLALQTGDLDEAAKIRNDMDAAAQEWALSDAAAAGENRSESRQDRLGDRIDKLEDRKDAALDALDKREEKERESLERRQKMNREFLEQQAQDAKDAFEREADYRRDSLEKQLETFKAFVPKNQKQLKLWMDEMGITYENFGLDFLQPEANKWGKWFKKSFTDNMRNAGLEIGSDNMWSKLGDDMARATLNGMGFTMRSFKKFIATGELPDSFGTPIQREGKPPRTYNHIGDHRNHDGVYHEGGIVGSQGSRKGVARTLKKPHPSEQLALLRKKEFVVNAASAKKYGGELEAINNGTFQTGPGLAGMVSGVVGSAFATGLSGAIYRAVSNKVASSMAAPALWGVNIGLAPGDYAGTSFTAEQLENASIIASVGRSMSMSMRDIAIGLMTAMAESGLRNLDYGDRDSVGLFQQRHTQGWGSIEQIMNPVYSATKFFEALKNVTNRDSMTPWMAAQTVQRSAFSDGSNYQVFWDEGQALVSALRNVNSTVARRGATNTVSAVQEFAKKQIGKPYVWGAEGPNGYDCSGLQSTLINFIKGNPLYGDGSRLFATGSMATAIPRLGFLRGNGGASDYSIGWRTGNPGHTSARIGNMPIESTGDGDAVRSAGATPVTAFPNQWHLPLKEVVDNITNPSRPPKSPGRGDKPAKIPWTKKDGFASSSESWGEETTKVDPNESTGYWTWISGLADSAIKMEAVSRAASSSDPNQIRTGTYNVRHRIDNARTIEDIKKLMDYVDILSLQEVSGKKREMGDILSRLGWGWTAAKTGTAITWNKSVYDLLDSGVETLSPSGDHRYAAYGKFRNKNGGTPFWQISAHTQAWPQRNAEYRARQLVQYANLRDLWKRLHSNGTPVILSGDLNSSIKRGDWIKRIGLGPGTNSGPATHGNSWLDHILYAGLNKTDQKVIDGLSSDHNALISNFNIPSHKNGAENIRWDNTLVNLHKKEAVLTAEQSDKFRYTADNIDKIAMGGGNQYDIKVEVIGSNISEDVLAEKIMQKIKREEARKPQSRRG